MAVYITRVYLFFTLNRFIIWNHAKTNLIAIDQHAAHERIRLEFLTSIGKYMKFIITISKINSESRKQGNKFSNKE